MLDLSGVVSVVPENLACVMFNLKTQLVADDSSPLH